MPSAAAADQTGLPAEAEPTLSLGTPEPEAAPPVRQRLEVLDGVRLLAAMLVVIFHFSAGDRSTWVTPAHVLFKPLFPITAYGWLGVELFFMISGFVICMSSWGKSVTEFAISRFVRLFPAYWIAVLLTTLVLVVDPVRFRALSWPQVLDNMTMTESYAHVPYVDPSYWTLTVELTFYVLFGALVVRRGLTYRRVLTFAAAWLVASAGTIWVKLWLVDLILQPVYAPCFVAGLVLYLVHRFGPNRLLWTMLGCAWVSAMYRVAARTSGQHPSGAILHYWVAASAETAFFVLLTLIALGKLAAIRGRWLVTAGALTYPLYLLHQQIGEAVIRSLHTRVSPWPLLAAALAGILALSWLVHRFAERPLARRLRRLLLAMLTPAPAHEPQRRATNLPATRRPSSGSS